MASFNLGRIKGDKGEKGDTGAKGERGDKGEQGERGQRGTDGKTPVFSIGATETLSSDLPAYVEIDAADAENPVLNFGIPKGADGKDANGDMIAGIYDPSGKKQDVFEYAKTLFDKCIGKTGGNLTGELTAYESTLSIPCVRNISISENLPENSANGDICIITETKSGKTLGECPLGMPLVVKEGGTETSYIIVSKGYHGDESVTLVRKELTEAKIPFNNEMRGSYIASDADLFLETVYIKLFEEKLRKLLLHTKIERAYFRYCFLLSHTELEEMEYFSQTKDKSACKNCSTEKGAYITRSALSNVVYAINENGVLKTVSQREENFLRPAIVLPFSTVVENTVKGTDAAVKLRDVPCGIYVLVNGEWKGCM